MRVFTISDVGCYGDSALGHKYVRQRLGELVSSALMGSPHSGHGAKLDIALLAPMSDDASEENEAIELLNDNACNGVYFDFVDGDLMLVPESDHE